MYLEELINKHFSLLNENDIYILQKLIENMDSLREINIENIAKLCNTSTASLHRLTKKLGFSGFMEFKYYLKDYQKKIMKENQIQYGKNDFSNSLQEDIKLTLDSMNPTTMNEICTLLYNAKNIYGFGTGWKQKSALNTFINDLMYYDKQVIQLRTLSDKHHLFSHLSKNDVFIVISLSGSDKELSNIINILKLNGVSIISITSLDTSLIASQANHSLYFKKNTTPTPHIIHWSPITLHIVIDSIVSSYAEYKWRKDVKHKEEKDLDLHIQQLL